jgi:hypothetical protein
MKGDYKSKIHRSTVIHLLNILTSRFELLLKMRVPDVLPIRSFEHLPKQKLRKRASGLLIFLKKSFGVGTVRCIGWHT